MSNTTPGGTTIRRTIAEYAAGHRAKATPTPSAEQELHRRMKAETGFIAPRPPRKPRPRGRTP